MITENQKDNALQLLRKYEVQSSHVIRVSIYEDCPTEDFISGKPQGDWCQGDGHYMCEECKLFVGNENLPIYLKNNF